MKTKIYKLIAISIFYFGLCSNLNAQLVSTIAGSGSIGNLNGSSSVAQFNYPVGIAADNAGNLYIADYFNNVIRKRDAAGNVTTFAGSGTAGFANGPAATAQFKNPNFIAIDAAGNVLVTDSGNNCVRIISGGFVYTFAGSGIPGFENGTSSSAKFNNPFGITIDNAGNVYIADHGNSMIRKIDTGGNVTTFAGSGISGYANGSASSAQFSHLAGIVVDASGNNIYVADGIIYSAIRKISAGLVSTYAGTGVSGYGDGIVTIAQFNTPTGLALDTSGNLFVSDSNNNRIRKIDTTGNVTTIAGAGGGGFLDGIGVAAYFHNPIGITFDNASNLIIVDTNNQRIRKITFPTLSTNETIKQQISIYPNPTKDKIFIQDLKNITGIKIYDSTGKLVINRKTNSETVDVSNLPKGIYFLEVVVENKVLKTKFIKE